ncbi:MAG TPA: hypothetical protein PK730_04700 [Candidatus Cloacimonas acidaminovorans]|nr:hypothetical protein [Candidatus Cloacimonas acidaminovorans]
MNGLIGEKVKDEKVERWKSEKVKQGDNLIVNPEMYSWSSR